MQKWLVRGTLLLVLALGPGLGCDDDDDTTACEAAAIRECFCADGSDSVQVCNAEGGWDACRCDMDGDGYIAPWERDPTVYGEWCDPTSNLCWQNPERTQRKNEIGWHVQEAIEYCETLVLLGHDDWRLPTINDMRTLIRGCPYNETGGDCAVNNASTIQDYKPSSEESAPCMSACFTENPSGPGVDDCYWPVELGSSCKRVQSTSPKEYWSSSLVEGSKEALGDEYYWYVFFGEGGAIGYNFKMSYSFQLCVRDAS